MKKLIALLFIFWSVHVFAQKEWAPIGAKWYYSVPNYGPLSFNAYGPCVSMESTKDTIINGLNCKVLELRECDYDFVFTRIFLHQDSFKIFYFNEYESDFYLLYNFSAKISDTISVHKEKFMPIPAYFQYNEMPPFEYRIDETDSIEISGTWLKRQKVTPLRKSYWMPGNFLIERLGSDIYFFGRSISSPATGEFYTGELRCYSDSSINYKSTTWDKNCDFVTKNEYVKYAPNKLYPNPVTEHVTIEFDVDKFYRIDVLDNLGHRLFTANNFDRNILVNLEKYKQGIYFIKITISNSVNTYKIIKK